MRRARRQTGGNEPLRLVQHRLPAALPSARRHLTQQHRDEHEDVLRLPPDFDQAVPPRSRAPSAPFLAAQMSAALILEQQRAKVNKCGIKTAAALSPKPSAHQHASERHQTNLGGGGGDAANANAAKSEDLCLIGSGSPKTIRF